MIKIFEESGDFNSLLSDEVGQLPLDMAVKSVVLNRGYYTMDKKSNRVFIPFHRIDSIREVE